MALDISKKILGNVAGGTNFAQYGFPVASGVTVTQGDFVYFSSGRITSATITGDSRPVGMVTETATGNAAGTVLANVVIDDAVRYLLQTDAGGTFDATSVGKYFDLTGATGAQKVTTSGNGSTTTGVMLCLEYNPQIDPVKTDTTYGVFILVESALDPLGS